MTLAHDPDAMTVTDVEPGPWLAEGDADVRVDRDSDDGAGTVTLTQTREADDGVTGSGTLLTVTLAVAEDAPAGNHTLAYSDTEVRMTNGHSQPTFTHNGTVTVTDRADDPDGGDDGTPGWFGLGIATVVAVAILGAVLLRVRARDG